VFSSKAFALVAKDTKVAIDKTETEIKSTLQPYGATSFAERGYALLVQIGTDAKGRSGRACVRALSHRNRTGTAGCLRPVLAGRKTLDQLSH
jgi:hypothetical protein